MTWDCPACQGTVKGVHHVTEGTCRLRTIDIDPIIVREAYKVVGGAVGEFDRFLLRITEPDVTHVSWTGVAGVTQLRPILDGADTFEYTTLARDYAKILARG